MPGPKIADYLTSANAFPGVFAHTAGCGCLASLRVDFALRLKGSATIGTSAQPRRHHLPAKRRRGSEMTRLRQMLGQERGFALVIDRPCRDLRLQHDGRHSDGRKPSTPRHFGSLKGPSVGLRPHQRQGSTTQPSIVTSNSYDPHLLHHAGKYAQADCASPPANPTGAALLGNTCSSYTWTYDELLRGCGLVRLEHLDWTITSTVPVRNPFGGAATTRTLTRPCMFMQLPPRTTTSLPGTTSSSKTQRPTSQHAARSDDELRRVPLFEGNLCFKNSTYIAETDPTNPISLEIRNKIVWLSGSQKVLATQVFRATGKSAPRRSPTAAPRRSQEPGPPARPGDYFYADRVATRARLRPSTRRVDEHRLHYLLRLRVHSAGRGL